ncbi:MAG: hypothetical protein IKL08_03095 [Clostridia bacterium]|nr:hypothetical protein [Clostridia bacterium]
MLFKKFKENYVFNKYKDKCFKNSAELKGEIYKNYKKINVDINSLYIKIVNYQVKKYNGILRG